MAGLNLQLDGDASTCTVHRVAEEVIRQTQAESAQFGKLAYGEAEAAALLSLAPHQLRDERLKGRIRTSIAPEEDPLLSPAAPRLPRRLEEVEEQVSLRYGDGCLGPHGSTSGKEKAPRIRAPQAPFTMQSNDSLAKSSEIGNAITTESELREKARKLAAEGRERSQAFGILARQAEAAGIRIDQLTAIIDEMEWAPPSPVRSFGSNRTIRTLSESVTRRIHACHDQAEKKDQHETHGGTEQGGNLAARIRDQQARQDNQESQAHQDNQARHASQEKQAQQASQDHQEPKLFLLQTHAKQPIRQAGAAQLHHRCSAQRDP